ncbi:MAG: shikimate dehydrogenase [Chloroflexi bacterium]|nr:shikimate dehydrogenase [Chloroflexota bacterium]
MGARGETVPTFYFIGVTTGQSSSRRMFPLWMDALGQPEVVWAGVDLPIHAEPERYRQVVAQIKHDPLSLGGLVTTHKIDLLEAARDMFDELDPYAQLLGEVSSISKREGRLIGHATDPVAGGLSLDAILGEAYFARTGGEVLCLGAGGAAAAISLHLMNKSNPGDRPRRMVVVNRSQGRLDRLRRMIEQLETGITFEYICNQNPARNDELLAELPPGSLVINATGMGKDTPGSPLTSAGLFPLNGIAWELNYRGELDFMRQALAQQKARNLTVEDGWLYFIHGWAQVIAHVLHLDIDQAMLHCLAELAANVR